MISARIQAAQPPVLLADAERMINERIGDRFEFASHEFEKALRDMVSRVYSSDGRSSRDRRIAMVDKIWGRGRRRQEKARTARELEASIRAKEVGRE